MDRGEERHLSRRDDDRYDYDRRDRHREGFNGGGGFYAGFEDGKEYSNGGFTGRQSGNAPLTEPEILALIEARNNAKMTRQFDEADRVRDELIANGITIDDRTRTWTARDGRSGEMPLGGGFARGDKKTEDGSLTWENTIYVAGLPTDVTSEEIADFFGRLGQIKKSKKNFNLGEPTIHIYRDKRTGRPKGDCTVSYEETETAQSAIKWYDGATFMNRPGSKMSISIAKRPTADRFGKGGKGKGGKGGW